MGREEDLRKLKSLFLGLCHVKSLDILGKDLYETDASSNI